MLTEVQLEIAAQSKKTTRELALELYKPPFTFIYGYVYDGANRMVADDGDCQEKVQRVRGWGRISYLPKPEALQDEFGKIMAEALNAFYEQQAIAYALAQEQSKSTAFFADAPSPDDAPPRQR